MNTNAVNLQTIQNFSNTGVSKVLNQGDSVLVRVIADKGGNRYEGSVAGVRVNLTSANPLQPGDKFVATVNLKNGVINLIPENNGVANGKGIQGAQILSLVSGESGELLQPLQNPALSAYLKMMGLPDNNLSLHLFQQMKQLGLKYNPAILKRLYNISLKYKGKEKRAAELLMEMLQKNIDFDEDVFEILLSQYEGQSKGNLNYNFAKDDEESDTETDDVSLEKMVNLFVASVFSDEDGAHGEIGVLAVFNHTGWNVSGTRKDNCSWCVLPFDIVCGNAIEGNGRISICLDAGLNFRKMNLLCNYGGNEFSFLIEMDGNCCKKINFYCSGWDGNTSEIEDKIKELKKRLMKINQNAVVEWTNKEKIEGFAGGTEEIFILGGSV